MTMMRVESTLQHLAKSNLGHTLEHLTQIPYPQNFGVSEKPNGQYYKIT